ncbi:2-phospho-L-lactate guanylyltransferase [Rhizorhabdus argentea]|uniref:2-phospho-L-lactate guanylyltransferase n=1 Tax=Rhizorhabdus argentea TaxID=1387174 RepID=UPI0030EF0B83
MACYALLAVRPPGEGKSRLAGALSDAAREALNYSMFRHILGVTREVILPAHIIVVSRSEALLDEARAAGCHAEPEHGDGLNQALSQAGRAAVDRGAAELLSLSSDLPFLGAEDIATMFAARGDVVIATDRLHIGTNALLMRQPFAIPFSYGLGSLAAHLAAAEKAGLKATVVDSPGLARDIDTPADLAELSAG